MKNVGSTLNTNKNIFITNRTTEDLTDPTEKVIPSIFSFNTKTFESSNSFSFKAAEINDVEKEINNINPKKAITNNSISPKMLKNSIRFLQVFYISYSTNQ